MWNFFTSQPCLGCLGKDALIRRLDEQLLLLKSQLAHSREREEKAVDALLERQGSPSVTPQPRMTATDSEGALRSVMGIFLDDDDKGDGKIRDVDNLDFDHR